MAIRTTVDVPEPLYETLRNRSEQTGASMRSLIVQAIELTYAPEKKGKVLTGPLVKGKGKLGPLGEGGLNANDFLFPDLNVWFALSVEGHAHGGAAWQWLERLPTGPKIVFCTHTFLGLIRLLTNSAAMGKRIMTISQALEVYDAWMGDPRVVFFSEPRDLSAGFKEAIAPLGKLSATNAVSDCYLAAFSKEVGATLVTIDRPLFSAVRKRGGKAICLV